MNPPGRFLKQDPNSKLWNDIGEKKALDKTRQALREGAPELLKEIEKTDGGASSVPNTANAALQQQVTAATAAAARGPAPAHPDYTSSLNQLGHNNTALRDSLTGGLSIGSFSFGSQGNNNLSNSFTTGGAASGIPGQVNIGNFGGINAANPMQNMSNMAQNLAQLDMLQRLQGQQNGGVNAAQMNMNLMSNNMQLQQALVLAAQQGTLSNDQLLSIMAMNANVNANNTFGNAYQQAQVTQALLMQQMGLGGGLGNLGLGSPIAGMGAIGNNSASTLVTGNLSNDLAAANQQKDVANQSAESAIPDTTKPLAGDDTVPPTITDAQQAKSNNLDSPLTRAQRIGHKNSHTNKRAKNRHDANNPLKNSLMSIDSLTLEDIEKGGGNAGDLDTNVSGVFDDSEKNVNKAQKRKHDGSPHADMSDVSDGSGEAVKEIANV
mmetsp:Transcript_18887/g.44251  ORF Transcript_18887/g.44251 Transcript_18887/m.44251 type:complete len:436 (+) Transcript_18887:509-1816(+)